MKLDGTTKHFKSLYNCLSQPNGKIFGIIIAKRLVSKPFFQFIVEFSSTFRFFLAPSKLKGNENFSTNIDICLSISKKTMSSLFEGFLLNNTTRRKLLSSTTSLLFFLLLCITFFFSTTCLVDGERIDFFPSTIVSYGDQSFCSSMSSNSYVSFKVEGFSWY